MFAAGNRDAQRLVRFGHALVEHPGHHGSEQYRSEQRSEQQRGQQGAAIAQVFQELLGENRQEGCHQPTPSVPPSTCRNASSSDCVPFCSRMASAVPSASTRPCPMMTTRSQSAATSCMTCEENRMQRPPAFRARSMSRRLRTAITSSPLVGSSRMRFPGSCTSARASATLIRWPCEKPLTRRSMKLSMPRACASSAARRLRRERLNLRAAELAQALGMESFIDRRVKGFSQGQRIKVALARALVHDPGNLILDEPTNGLDVMAVRSLRDMLRALKAGGRCIPFSSHVMQEVAALCDRVVIIGHGRVLANGTAEAIREQNGTQSLEEAFLHVLGGTEGVG